MGGDAFAAWWLGLPTGVAVTTAEKDLLRAAWDAAAERLAGGWLVEHVGADGLERGLIAPHEASASTVRHAIDMIRASIARHGILKEAYP